MEDQGFSFRPINYLDFNDKETNVQDNLAIAMTEIRIVC